MSTVGIIAGGLAGGAAAAGEIARTGIEQDRRNDSARLLMEMEELKANRLADAQAVRARQSGKDARADALAFTTDPANIEATNVADRSRALAAGESARAVETAGLNDTGLLELRRSQADTAAADDTRRKGAAIEALTPAEVKRQGLIAEANAKAQAKYREPKVHVGADVKQKYEAMKEILGRDLNEQEKLAVLGILKNQRDPELDTETITEEVMNPDGTTRKTQRKEVRRPGSGKEQVADDPIKAAMDAERAKKQEAKTAKAASPAQPAIPVDPIQSMNRRTLNQIAAIQGHVNQQAASAELKRRDDAQPENVAFP